MTTELVPALLPGAGGQVGPAPRDLSPVNVFVLYTDFEAGRRAMRMLGDMFQRAGEEENLTPRLWRADLLKDPGFNAQAIRELAEADLMVLSLDRPAAFADAVEDCVSKFLGAGSRSSSTILAQFGPDDCWSMSVPPCRASADDKKAG